MADLIDPGVLDEDRLRWPITPDDQQINKG
jgi:hypothetical protein